MNLENTENQQLMSDRLPLFQRVLGDDWHKLHPEIRAMHAVDDIRRSRGEATITRGDSVLARVVAFVLRMPTAGRDVPVTVTMSQRGATEHWLRDFAGNRFSTVLSESGGGLFERFGLMQFELALAVEDGSLALPVRGGRILGIPLPSKLLPVSISREFVVDGRFHFDVELLLPIVGLRIVRYQGWLTIDDACCSPR